MPTSKKVQKPLEGSPKCEEACHACIVVRTRSRKNHLFYKVLRGELEVAAEAGCSGKRPHHGVAFWEGREARNRIQGSQERFAKNLRFNIVLKTPEV